MTLAPVNIQLRIFPALALVNTTIYNFWDGPSSAHVGGLGPAIQATAQANGPTGLQARVVQTRRALHRVKSVNLSLEVKGEAGYAGFFSAPDLRPVPPPFVRPFSGFYKAREGLRSLPPAMVGIMEASDCGWHRGYRGHDLLDFFVELVFVYAKRNDEQCAPQNGVVVNLG
ncbi:hypothetical protein NC652_015497 [Populus alba x Populus x berolinensis]|nr:hypothetical protein NC652_015497 [Populus alba x Populus x berolinensis]